MDRYMRILSASFDGSALPGPMEARLTRRAEPLPAAGDADSFASSVQLHAPRTIVEVRIRGTKAAEGFAIGAAGELSFTVAAANNQAAGRRITIARAILAAVELAYEQTAPATARLRFVAESLDGETDPFLAEDDQ